MSFCPTKYLIGYTEKNRDYCLEPAGTPDFIWGANLASTYFLPPSAITDFQPCTGSSSVAEQALWGAQVNCLKVLIQVKNNMGQGK